jgi:hypothetical protein
MAIILCYEIQDAAYDLIKMVDYPQENMKEIIQQDNPFFIP